MEAKMDNTKMGDTQKFMHNTFWLEDRISVTFKVLHQVSNAEELLHTAKLPPPFPTLPTIVKLLGPQVDFLNRLIEDLGVRLSFFLSDDLPMGQYLFGPDKINPDTGDAEARVVSFLHLESNDGIQPGFILRTVNRINKYLQSPKNQPEQQDTSVVASASSDFPRDETQVLISSAAPTYLCGATQADHVTQGCPLTPPIPVSADAICSC